jgi:restriction modification system DNA specificity domain protein
MIQMVSLGDICDIKIGRTPPRKQPQWFSESHGIKWVSIKDMGNTGKYISQTSEFLTADAIKKFNIPIIPAGTLLMSFKLTVGRLGFTEYDMCSNEAIAQLPIKDPDIVDKNYLYYYLKNFNFGSLSSTSSIATAVNSKTVKNISVNLPPLDRQKKIANILGSLDEKIELNRRMNETLEQLGQALFRHYFVDNPEAKSWESGTLGDIVVNFDSRRKPLSSKQRAKMQGDYRYFGATSVMDHVNDYLFDGTYLLLAEDGSVMRSDGTPYLQYVWGRFWVNNHAHIIQAKYPFTVEYLYLLLAKTNVQSLVSGAVQLKINQRAMNSLVISIPPDDLVIKFCNLVNSLFAQYRENEGQIELLVNLRDSLLPKLISGEVEI